MPSKRYCYVDESGQDTHGVLFIVAVVVVAEDRDAFIHLCTTIERATGKLSAKWRKTIPARRLSYMQCILTASQFSPEDGHSKLNVAMYHDTLDYLDCTAETVALALQTPGHNKTDIVVLIDALPPTHARTISHMLRRAGVSTKKVRGVRRDENDALIRLADAVCGFVRDAIDGNPDARTLYDKAVRDGIISVLT